MKTRELIGPALDWAVAKCGGWDVKPNSHRFNESLVMIKNGSESVWFEDFNPSTDWAQGGPIIEREKIATAPYGESEWLAYYQGVAGYITGTTHLIAAMRCYVASKLGDEIEIPEELK
jgi:hypothetical protein